MFQKDLAYFKIGFKNMLAYKFEALIWVIVTPVTLAVYYFFWKAIFVYGGQTAIRGYTFNELINYFILIQLTTMFIWSDVDSQISKAIRTGKFVTKLARPAKVMLSLLFAQMGEISVVIALEAPPLLAIGIVFFGLHLTSWSLLGLAVLSFILTFLLNSLLTFFIGLSAFWVVKYKGIRRIKNGLVWFLGGGVIPLAFFPEVWQKVFAFLPFYYTMYAPVQIYLGKLDPLKTLSLQFFWILFFYALIKLVWPKALSRFSAAGG